MEIKNMRPNERALSPLPLSLPLGFRISFGFRSSAFGFAFTVPARALHEIRQYRMKPTGHNCLAGPSDNLYRFG